MQESVIRERVYANAGNPPLLALVPERPGRALDCGCGAGDNARLLRARGWTVTGVTLSPEEQRAASAHCERVLLANLEQPLPAEAGSGYDLVVLSHVLEHLVDPRVLLREARRVLAPGGRVAVALPNVLFYPVRLKALFGRFDYTTDGIMDATHVHFYTFATGADLLRANGFDVLKAEAEGGMPLRWLRRGLPGAWVESLDRWACRRWPGLFGRQCLYLARPRPGDAASAPR
jgi:SAM-dependent methyltransferase